MKSLNDCEWKAFKIESLFLIVNGVRLTKADMIPGNRPFIGATDSNNGITEFCNNKNRSLDKNVLGINYNGSVGECFYHPYECIFSDDVKHLKIRGIEGNKYIFLFLQRVIYLQSRKYKYGYKFNEDRMKAQKILLPITKDGVPDWKFMEEYMKSLEVKIIDKWTTFTDKISKGQ